LPDLKFQVEHAEPVRFAASPLLGLTLRISNAEPEERIHTVALRVQVQIDAARRRYSPGEQERLRDLFGEPGIWSRTLRSLLWTHTSLLVPSFTGSTTAELQLPCSFDFDVAATKYFSGVEGGDIPLTLLFSGTVFYASADAPLQVVPISWDKETRFRVPVETWRSVIEEHYPNCAWLALERDVFDRINDYKTRNGIPRFADALTRLLDSAGELSPQ
jgi:hypothetical protein